MSAGRLGTVGRVGGSSTSARLLSPASPAGFSQPIAMQNSVHAEAQSQGCLFLRHKGSVLDAALTADVLLGRAHSRAPPWPEHLCCLS